MRGKFIPQMVGLLLGLRRYLTFRMNPGMFDWFCPIGNDMKAYKSILKQGASGDTITSDHMKVASELRIRYIYI